MKVINRSDGNITYSLPEFNIRRVFLPGTTKDIEPKELEALWQTDGGAALIKDYLLVTDKDWVKAHWDAPIEYFWNVDEIKKCLLEDSQELFEETLDYAPEGVLDLIKSLSWQIPITDLNKCSAIYNKTGFDVLGATELMQAQTKNNSQPQNSGQGRKRKEV